MKTKASPSSSDPEYLLLLPSPAALKSLADGTGGSVPTEALRALAELEKAGGAVPPEQAAVLFDRVITECALADDDAAAAASVSEIQDKKASIYDYFFCVRRLSPSAPKQKMINALVVALAVVMKNTAALENGSTGVTSVEFGLLGQAFGTIIEALRELIADPGTPLTPRKGQCPLHGLLMWFRFRTPQPTKTVKQLAAIVADLDSHALKMWREGHYLFFVLIELATIELRRFINATAVRDFVAAIRHLGRASTLLLGSAAAMRIAADVNQDSYANAVVPAMKAAHPKFSGSDSADHTELVET